MSFDHPAFQSALRMLVGQRIVDITAVAPSPGDEDVTLTVHLEDGSQLVVKAPDEHLSVSVDMPPVPGL